MNRPFPVDEALTAVALGFRNSAAMRIADAVLPRLPVSAERFKWTEYPISEAFNVPDARVGRRGRVQQLEFGGTEQTSEVIDYGLESSIPYSDIQAAEDARARGDSAHNPLLHAVAMLTDTIENIREARVAALVTALDTYASDKRVTLSGTSQWSDYTNSDPITAIKTGMEATLVYTPNTMVMGRHVWNRLPPRPVAGTRGSLMPSHRPAVNARCAVLKPRPVALANAAASSVLEGARQFTRWSSPWQGTPAPASAPADRAVAPTAQRLRPDG
jgi:hypothetical protein